MAAASLPGSRLARAAFVIVSRPMLMAIASAGVALTATAVYLVAVSPPSSSADIVVAWAAIGISALALVLYAAVAGRSLPLPHGLLISAGLLWVLWLLLASQQPAAFTTGGVLTGLLVPLVACELLASLAPPIGRRTRTVLIASTIGAAGCWILLWLTSRQPTLIAPLDNCVPSCPRNPLFLGSAPSSVTDLTRVGAQLGWVVASAVVALHVARRFARTAAVARRGITPTLAVALAYALAVAICVGITLTHPGAHPPLGWISLTAATLLPISMLAGLIWERLFMGEALEGFVTALPDTAPEDQPALMAELLHEPAVQTGDAKRAANGRARADEHVEHHRASGLGEHSTEAALVQLDVAPDQQRFIRAAGTAAQIYRENHRLESDLSASTVALAASRRRLADAAYAERKRIERDIHDGIQQRMVGARVKLELADDAFDVNPARGRRMLAEIGCELDDALGEVRSLAQGVYPALLETHGLLVALQSAARRAPGAVTVRGEVGRYPSDTEAAVYFCCLETLQNVAKHAGRDATATVRLWEEDSSLFFQTRDSGVGFAAGTRPSGQGLINMHDRLEAIGGRLTLRSRAGLGTVVRGCVPIG